jgi:hypothetical protein
VLSGLVVTQERLCPCNDSNRCQVGVECPRSNVPSVLYMPTDGSCLIGVAATTPHRKNKTLNQGEGRCQPPQLATDRAVSLPLCCSTDTSAPLLQCNHDTHTGHGKKPTPGAHHTILYMSATCGVDSDEWVQHNLWLHISQVRLSSTAGTRHQGGAPSTATRMHYIHL